MLYCPGYTRPRKMWLLPFLPATFPLVYYTSCKGLPPVSGLMMPFLTAESANAGLAPICHMGCLLILLFLI